MTPSEIQPRLLSVLVGIGLNETALTDQANFTHDLGLDSLDVTDLLLQVETAFGIRIADEDFWKLITIGALKDFLADELNLTASHPV